MSFIKIKKIHIPEPTFNVFYGVIFISFSIGVFLQWKIPKLIYSIWAFIFIGFLLLIMFIIQIRKKGIKNEN